MPTNPTNVSRAIALNILHCNGHASITNAQIFISDDIDKLLALVERNSTGSPTRKFWVSRVLVKAPASKIPSKTILSIADHSEYNPPELQMLKVQPDLD